MSINCLTVCRRDPGIFSRDYFFYFFEIVRAVRSVAGLAWSGNLNEISQKGFDFQIIEGDVHERSNEISVATG